MGSGFTLGRSEKGGIAALGVGVLVLLFARVFGVSHGFWLSYTEGFRVLGWSIIGTGAGWLLLSLLHSRTTFFDLQRRINAEKFGISIGAAALITVIALAVVIPQLPATEESNLPQEPALRQQVLNQERHLRAYLAGALLFAGASICVFPAIRFFRK